MATQLQALQDLVAAAEMVDTAHDELRSGKTRGSQALPPDVQTRLREMATYLANLRIDMLNEVQLIRIRLERGDTFVNDLYEAEADSYKYTREA